MQRGSLSQGKNYTISLPNQIAAPANLPAPIGPQMQTAQMWHVKLLMDTGAALAANVSSQQSWDAFLQYAKANGLDDDGHLPAVFDPRIAMHYALLGLTVSDQLSAQLKQMLGSQDPVGNQLLQSPSVQSVKPASSDAIKANHNAAPLIGQVQDGYRYLGGHPGRASNWIPVLTGHE